MSKVTRAFYGIISIIIGISFFWGFLTSPTSALTEESEVDVKFTFNPMLTLSVSSADIVIPNLIPGTSDNSNTVAVTVNTNNISGYSLSATVGNTTNSSRNLVHTALNTNLFSSIDTSSNITAFTTDNTWGYSIDDGAHYSGLPIYTDTPKEIKKTTEAGNSYTNFLIGAKASSTQISGDYTNVINFTVVANPEPVIPPDPGTIKYYPNSAAIGEMGDQTVTNSEEVVLYAPNFKNAGYGFAGWNTEPDGSGTMYGPQQTITTPSDVETTGLGLYAIWIPSNGTLQNWTGCSSLASGAVTALTDSRDSNTYAVAKLADGKCWMIENLRLDNTAILTSANTNNPALPLTNTDGTTSNHLSPTTDPTQTAWCIEDSPACINKSMTTTNNTTLFMDNVASSYDAKGNVYSYGNYYNWYSATAGNGIRSIETNNQSVTGSICPVGWGLPIGGSWENRADSDFWKLSIATIGSEPTDPHDYYTGEEGPGASRAMRAYPSNFLYAGYIYGTSGPGGPFYDRGAYGDYWSSTTRNNYGAYLFHSANWILNPGTFYYAKYEGLSVRCLANN